MNNSELAPESDQLDYCTVAEQKLFLVFELCAAQVTDHTGCDLKSTSQRALPYG